MRDDQDLHSDSGLAPGTHIDVPIRSLPSRKGLPLPDYQTEGAAGMDLLAAIPEDAPQTLSPGARALVQTGIEIALPQGYEAQIRPRSGLALKHGVTCLNTPGTIDSDYRGEIGVLLINLGQDPFVIMRGMRIAQMVIAPVTRARLRDVQELPASDRDRAGFGSTGSI